MANILAHSRRVTMSTSFAMLTTVYDIFSPAGVRQSTPQSATVITTPPVFAGITGLVANTNGSLTASWSAATNVNLPTEYWVYIKAGTATGLFSTSPVEVVTGLSVTLFTDSFQTLLAPGTYYVGVKARDGVQNVDINTVSLSAVSIGVPSTSVLLAIAAVQTTLGVPANGTVSADLAEIEGETDGISAIPTNPLLTSDARLNHLDADISSRLASASYTAPDNSDIVLIKLDTTSIKAKTDNLPATPSSQGDVTTVGAAVAAIPINPLLTIDSRLNHLDADISTRLPTSSYVAPDNADIVSIKAKTDNLPVDPASESTLEAKLTEIKNLTIAGL